ncbi:MAG: phosphatase PAP2 family protein [Nocardioides sp.]
MTTHHEVPTSRRSSDDGRPAPVQVLGVRATTRLLVALVAGIAAVSVLVAVRWQPLMSLDHAVARWAFGMTVGHSGAITWWNLVAAAAEPINLRVLMLVGGLVLLWRRRWDIGGWLVGVAVLEQVVGPYAKYVLNRPRPHWTHPIDTLSTSSYPAGHATGIACFASVLVLLTLVTVRSPAVRRALMGVAVLLTVLVCVDRLLLGMHYLSDVVGGLMLGLATTLVCWLAMLLLRRDEPTG